MALVISWVGKPKPYLERGECERDRLLERQYYSFRYWPASVPAPSGRFGKNPLFHTPIVKCNVALITNDLGCKSPLFELSMDPDAVLKPSTTTFVLLASLGHNKTNVTK